MLFEYLERFFKLLSTSAVILAFSYLLSTTKFGRRILSSQIARLSIKDKCWLCLFFGIFAFYCSLSITARGADLRIIGPVIAGFSGGPFCGLIVALAGLGGALVEHYLQISNSFIYTGNLTNAVVVSNCLAGLLSGWYSIRTRKMVTLKHAVIFIIAFDIFILFPSDIFLADNTSLMLKNAYLIFPPMLLVHVACVALFIVLIQNFSNEQAAKQIEEKINAEKAASLKIFNSLQRNIDFSEITAAPLFYSRLLPETRPEFDNRFFHNLTHNNHYYFLYAFFYGSQTPVALSISYVKPLFENLAMNDLPAQEIHATITANIDSFSEKNVRIQLICGKISIRSNTLNFFCSNNFPLLTLREQQLLTPENNIALHYGDVIIIATTQNTVPSDQIAVIEPSIAAGILPDNITDVLTIKIQNHSTAYLHFSAAIAADINKLQKLYEDSNSFCQKNNLGSRACRDVGLLLDETVSNAIKYSGVISNDNAIKIEITYHINTRLLEVIVSWLGIYFNPLTYSIIPEHKTKVPGGWGIFLIKKITDEILYERVSDYNILIMKKTYPKEESNGGKQQ